MIFVSLFSLVWIAFVYTFLIQGLNENDQNGFQIIKIFFAALMTFGGLLPVLVILGLKRSLITIDLSRERFVGRWHFGPMSVKKELPTDSITRVALTNRLEKSGVHNKHTINLGPESLQSVKVCTVYAGEELMPITTFHELATAREIAGLLIHRLEEMGITLQDA